MADRTWFDPDFGYRPEVPLNAIWVYIAVAVAQAGSLRGDGRRRIMEQNRSEAWRDYRASLKAVNGAAIWVDRPLFNRIWTQCIALWGATSPEMRKHGVTTKPKRSWTYTGRNGSQTYLRRFNYHMQLIASVQRGDELSSPDRFHVDIGFDTLDNHTINDATARASIESQNWRMSGSEIIVYAGFVTSIWRGN